MVCWAAEQGPADAIDEEVFTDAATPIPCEGDGAGAAAHNGVDDLAEAAE
jgi:hypothetical protein